MATDFVFNDLRASDFGLMICSFDNGEPTVTGGEVEFTVAKTPNRDEYTYYGGQLNSVLTWNFSVCKNPCLDDNMYFDQYEESAIAQWLMKKNSGYQWFQFDREGYENIYYKVYINMSPHKIAGRTVGFDLTVTSNCGYGFSDIITNSGYLSSSSPFQLNVHSDVDTYILPKIEIQGFNTGLLGNDPLSFYIYNENDTYQNYNKATKFIGINKDVTMDSDTDIITGISNPDQFGWYFLRLVNGKNTLITDLQDKRMFISISYREPRRVIV